MPVLSFTVSKALCSRKRKALEVVSINKVMLELDRTQKTGAKLKAFNAIYARAQWYLLYKIGVNQFTLENT